MVRMMNSSGRDSGYSENAGGELCETRGSMGADMAPFFRDSAKAISLCRVPQPASSELISKCDREGADADVHLFISPDCRITGSSCRALKHAVSNLTRLDDFICEKIGDGFFSEVFKVTHRVTGRVMVLKMNLLRSNRANMLKEVQLMNRLSHPNILKFMGVCVHEGQLHALSEYINGGSLEQLIQSSQELTYSMRIKLAADIAKGMQYLHSQDVFHRDLTSKNVLIKKSEDCKEMTAVVGDFGLAAKIPRPGVRLATVGSPWWMSPECLKGQCYDERSDVFSYGIVLCELIARVDADPDVLPRTSNFGLDYLAFVEICSTLERPPPPEFLKLAFSCCNLEPKNRPSFADLVKFLEKNMNPSKCSRYYETVNLPESRSEEMLLCLSPTPVMPSEIRNNHRKHKHRRSLSEDIGLIVFPASTAPAERASCHLRSHPPLKDVGESMCHEDPHYVPSDVKSNPFASLSKFKGVKKVLAQTNSTDLFSSCFELPSSFRGGDDRKPSFYTENMDTKAATQLPYITESSSGSRSMPHHENKISYRSSIVSEPVVKPSAIKNSVISKYSTSSEIPASTTVSVTDSGKFEKTGSKWRPNDSSVSTSSSTSSTSSCNTNSVTVRLKENNESKSRYDKFKPSSLPSSPTFARKRPIFSRYSFRKTDDVDNEEKIDAVNSSQPERKLSSPHLTYSPCQSPNCITDVLLPESPFNKLRSCSSSSNLNAMEDLSCMTFLPTAETPMLNLKRRGSCESGFYSSVGEDFCVPGIDMCVGHQHYTASSVTLSSSSAASSLFLDSNSEDNSTPVFFNGRYSCALHHRNTSSVYTDSSEDVSSLGGSETPAWDERQKPQHISKIVEYFERKQTNGGSTALSHKFDFLDAPSRLSNLHAIRRNWIHNEGQTTTRSSLDYFTRRKLFEKPFSGGSHVLAKRSANQRLLICEGAVKSKLPIFDKK